MVHYSVEEKIRFVQLYYQGNSIRQISDLCSGIFPNRPIPTVSSIYNIIQRFKTTGSVLKICKKCRKGENVVNLEEREQQNRREERIKVNENKLNVLLCVQENPGISIRKIAANLNIPRSSVYQFLKDQKYKAYKYSFHQELRYEDHYSRLLFCEIMIEKINEDRTFLQRICFTDECTFIMQSEPNKQNTRYWSTENPYLVKTTHTQYPQKVNVWLGIYGSNIIGPIFIDGALTGQKYLEMLENEVCPSLDAVSGNDEVWYQHDGCPAHFDRNVREYLNNVFPHRWIGRGGQINWPPRSPDLAPNDFFLWGYLKNKISNKNLLTTNDLKIAIREECLLISRTQLSNVRREFYDRLSYCSAVNGDVFEHLI